jgi:hypothetical protein
MTGREEKIRGKIGEQMRRAKRGRERREGRPQKRGRAERRVMKIGGDEREGRRDGKSFAIGFFPSPAPR